MKNKIITVFFVVVLAIVLNGSAAAAELHETFPANADLENGHREDDDGDAKDLPTRSRSISPTPTTRIEFTPVMEAEAGLLTLREDFHGHGSNSMHVGWSGYRYQP